MAYTNCNLTSNFRILIPVCIIMADFLRYFRFVRSLLLILLLAQSTACTLSFPLIFKINSSIGLDKWHTRKNTQIILSVLVQYRIDKCSNNNDKACCAYFHVETSDATSFPFVIALLLSVIYSFPMTTSTSSKLRTGFRFYVDLFQLLLLQ